MTYVFDTSSIRVLSNYYPERFPSFWDKFNSLVQQKKIISAREVGKELRNQITKTHMIHWINANKSIFLTPTPEETEFISEIFLVRHFQQLVNRQHVLSGGPVADPYVIALAKIRDACAITEEEFKPNAAKIPNVCEHFRIECMNFERMMEQEGWKF